MGIDSGIQVDDVTIFLAGIRSRLHRGHVETVDDHSKRYNIMGLFSFAHHAHTIIITVTIGTMIHDSIHEGALDVFSAGERHVNLAKKVDCTRV